MNVRQLLVVCGVSALVGAALWVYKGVAILATGDQPDHAFEVAPFFFGVAALTLLYAVIDSIGRPRWLLMTLAWLAATAGAVAAISHFAGQQDNFGDRDVSPVRLIFDKPRSLPDTRPSSQEFPMQAFSEDLQALRSMK